MNRNQIPAFGNLSGIRVLVHGATVASPFGPGLMAENGATVIQIENAAAVDSARVSDPPYIIPSERRNELGISLDVTSPKGHEIFLKLVETSDIIFEGNKGGTFEKWGYSDEELWKVNPKLVIIHVSCYGQTGSLSTKPGYDGISQAMGGYTAINGDPNGELMKCNQTTADYVSAIFALWAGLTAYIGAQRTGKGESVDLACYEAMWKIQGYIPMAYLRDGRKLPRMGNGHAAFYAVDNYKCKDDQYCFITAFGPGPMSNALKVLGLDNDPDFPTGYRAARKGTPEGEKFQKTCTEWFLNHTAVEAEKIFLDANIPCSRIYDIETIQENEHVKSRDLFIEWDDPEFGKVKGVGFVPKMSQRPARIFRGAPVYGMDNDDILAELGYNQSEIDEIYAERTMVKTPEKGGYRY